MFPVPKVRKMQSKTTLRLYLILGKVRPHSLEVGLQAYGKAFLKISLESSRKAKNNYTKHKYG